MSEDYETLGRYVASCEVLEKSLRERNRLLHELKLQIDRVVNTAAGWGAPVLFDFDQAERVLLEARKAFDQADRAAAEANSVAGRAGKPPVRWR